MNKDSNRIEKITKMYNHNNSNSNSNKSSNYYMRRDFLKLLRTGTAFLTIGGLLKIITLDHLQIFLFTHQLQQLIIILHYQLIIYL